MATLNRRTFLKFLSVSPAIFHASLGFGKIFHEPPIQLLSDSELLQAATEPTPILNQGKMVISYPGKPILTGGNITYHEASNTTTHIFTQSGTIEWTSMNLTKQFLQTAKWDATANSWWIGESVEYRWTNSKNQPTSDWMDLDTALQWIKKYDKEKETQWKLKN